MIEYTVEFRTFFHRRNLGCNIRAFIRLMKPMLLFYAVLFSLAFGIDGCKDKCGDIACRNGGDCENNRCVCEPTYFGKECEIRCMNDATFEDGLCYCQNGYEGPDCAALTRDRFVGTYTMDGYCHCGGANPVFIDPFQVNVTAASDDLSFNFSMLDASVSLPIEALVNGQSFDIPAQSFSGNITISGGGEFGETFLYISYGKIVGSGASTYTETYRLIGSKN